MPFRDKICISDAPFLTSAPLHIPIRQPISFSHLFPEAAHHEQDTQVLSSHDTETLCDLLLPHHLTPNRPCPRSVHSLLCIIPSSWQEKVFPLSSPGPWSSYPPPRTRTLLFRSLAPHLSLYSLQKFYCIVVGRIYKNISSLIPCDLEGLGFSNSK